MHSDDQKKLAVFFPGAGYTMDKPLVYYSRKLAAAYGYQEIALQYSGFPEKKPGDNDRMKQFFKIAYAQTLNSLENVEFSAYDDILFVGKSIGTIVAAKIASDSTVRERIRLILYTPLERTFVHEFGDAVVFTGNNDPWVGKSESLIPRLCRERNIPCHIIPDGNHSLESGNVQQDIRVLKTVMEETELFIKDSGTRQAGADVPSLT